jgi:hypothetical protein
VVLGLHLLAVITTGQAQSPRGGEDLDLDGVARRVVGALEGAEKLGGLGIAAALEQAAGRAEGPVI